MAVQIWSMTTFAALLPVVLGAAKMSGTSLTWSTPGVLWSATGAVLSTIACISFLIAVQGSQVYVVTGLTSTYPVFTMLFCWWFLGEPVTWTRAAGIFVIVCGTALLQM